MNNKTFVKTRDEKTAEKLRSYLNELPKEGSFFVFINDTTVMHFDEMDNVIFTNKINL